MAAYMSGQTVSLTAEYIFWGYVISNPGQRRIHKRFPGPKEGPQAVARQPHPAPLCIGLEMFRTQLAQITCP